MVYTIGLRSMSVTPTPKQQEGLPEGMTAIDFSIFKEGQGPKTLTQAINERRAAIVQPETGQPAKILSEEDWLLEGGLPAHRFLIDIGPAVNGGPGPDRVMSELVTMIKGQMVLVDGQGDQSLFNVIAASLREIP